MTCTWGYLYFLVSIEVKTCSISPIRFGLGCKIGIQYLSLDGKEVMVKAVAQFIPVYMMSCFALPFNVVQNIKVGKLK